MCGEELLDFLCGDGAEADDGAAGSDGGQEFAEIFGEDDDVGVVGWFFEDFEERVGGFLHEGGGGDDEDFCGCFRGAALGAVDEGADLAELDEELGWVGRKDEDVGVGLDENAGFFFVDFAHVLAGCDGFVNAGFEVGGFGDAGAVAAVAAEGS